MKRIAAAILFTILVLLPLGALAAKPMAAEPMAAEPMTGARGDDMLRAQLRLIELGYSSAPAGGVWRASDTRAMAAFEAAGGKSDTLFAASAPRAAAAAATQAEPAATTIYGGKMPWSEVKTRLSTDKRYLLTDCMSGVAVWLSFTGGEYAATMQPALAWDGATLASLFTGGSLSGAASAQGLPLDTRPVVLSIDGMLVAASMRMSPLGQTDGLTRLEVFFAGSGSGLSGLPDADHAASIEIAATAIAG